MINCFLSTITLFLMNYRKKTALFAHLWKNSYVCTIFCAVTYKVTAFFLIKISNKKGGENVKHPLRLLYKKRLIYFSGVCSNVATRKS